MNYTEKVKYIMTDYIKDVVEKTDDLTTEDEWFKNFIKLQNDFLRKYKGNSMYFFVAKLAVLYGDVIDAEYKKIKEVEDEGT